MIIATNKNDLATALRCSESGTLIAYSGPVKLKDSARPGNADSWGLRDYASFIASEGWAGLHLKRDAGDCYYVLRRTEKPVSAQLLRQGFADVTLRRGRASARHV